MRILLHGFLGSPSSWREVLDALPPLAAGAIECPALAGHAAGLAVPDDFEGEVDRLARRLEALEAPVHLVGYSLGGRFVLGLLCRHPQLWRRGPIERATLIGAHPGISDPGQRARRIEEDERWALRLEQEPFERFLELWRRQPVFEGLEGRVRPERLRLDAERRRRHDPRALARALRVFSLGRMPDWSEQLPQLELPIDLLVGERDARFRRLAETMRERLPLAHMEILEDAGHNLLLEAPGRLARSLAAERKGSRQETLPERPEATG